MASPKTAADLSWQVIVDALADRCRTSRGAEGVRAMRPMKKGDALARSKEIGCARWLEDKAAPMGFGGIEDIREPVERAAKGATLAADELISVARTARGIERLHDQLEHHQEDVPELWLHLDEIHERIGWIEAIHEPILRSFEPDGRLADHASPELGRLRKEVAKLKQQLESRAKKLLEDSEIVGELQDSYWTQREDRYVLPVRVSSKSKVSGIVHGSSGSGQTVYIEPTQLVELNNQLKLAECEVFEEEHRILAKLSEGVNAAADLLRSSAKVVAHLDQVSAGAKLAIDLQCHAPTFSEDGTLDLRRARHPLILLSGKECIANDIQLDAEKILVISGPNAGGKTVVLKTVGLAAMMSRHGLHICAGEGSVIPFYDQVLTAIGDSQSIESELSTFSAHLDLLRRFLKKAGKRSLVLIDEICSATEPEQGGALAQSVLETLAAKGVPAIISTHYERLKAMGAEDERISNASVGFDLETLMPTFHLHLGVPGASAALDVARRMKLPEEVLARALEIAGGGRTRMDELLRQVSDERERLMDERKALAEERQATAEAHEKARAAEERATARDEKEHKKGHAQALEALTGARKELDRIKTGLKKRVKVDELKKTGKDIDKLGSSISAHAPKAKGPGGKAPSADELEPGREVFVLSLRSKGTILAPPKGKQVQVQVGAMKSNVAIKDLRLAPRSKSNVKVSSTRRGGSSVQLVTASNEDRAFVRTADATIDVRGERGHDAVAMLDRFIDQSLLAAREAIFVVHGHGTGALRSAVRAHLEGHPSITQWRKGEAREGGDGVTVAWLDS